MERIIVRRGRFLTYELLRKTFGSDPNVEILWDRRRSENPVPEGGPKNERRGRLPEQWYQLDYLFTTGGPAALAQLPRVEQGGDSKKSTPE